MREKRLTRLFVRYRERGDVDALTSVFDATAPGLLGLARHVVKARDDAEDVVQATFLAAIEQSGAFDPAFSVRPWLTGILVRKAHQANARAARRIEPERLDERAAPDPEESASSAELSEALARALAALPERYRRVLQPFLRDGDRPHEIARRQGMAPGTVRVQIHRGLDHLRKVLPAGYAIGAGAAAVSTAVLQRMRAEVESAARSAAPAGATIAGAGSATLVPEVGRALAAAATVAMVGAGAWHIASLDRKAEGESPGDERVAPLAVSPPEVEGESLASVAASASSRTEALESGASPERSGIPWTLVANVTGVRGAAGENLFLSIASAGTTPESREVPIHGDGPLHVDLGSLASGARPELSLAVLHPAYSPFEYATSETDVRGDAELAVEVALERCSSLIEGRVVATSESVPVVAFYASPDDPVGIGPPIRTACGQDGEFRLFTSASSGWFVATATGCAPFGTRMDLSGFQDVDLGTIEVDAGASIAGVAYYQGLVPAEPGIVEAHNVATEDARRTTLNGTMLGFLEETVVTDSATARPDAAGAFRITGLTPGLYDVMSLPHTTVSGYYDPHTQGIRVTAPVANLELDSPVRVYSLQVVSEGRPVEDAMVRYNVSGGSVAGPTLRDGTYAFSMAASDERHRVEIEKPGFASREVVVGARDFDEAGSLQVELERTAPASELTLALSVDHGPIGPLRLRLSLADSDWYAVRSLSRTDGRIALGEVPAGRYRLEILPEIDEALGGGEQSLWLATELVVVCRESSSEEVPVRLLQGGRVVFHVPELDGTGPGIWHLRGPGAAGPLWLSTWDPVQGRSRTLYTPRDIDRAGEYWLHRALLPGEYHLDVSNDAGYEHSYPFLVSPRNAADVFLEE